MSAGLGLGALRYTLQRFALFAAFAAVMFAVAGRWDWPRGWAYLAATGVIEDLTLAVLAWRAPQTLDQRGRTHARMATFDRVFAGLWLLLAIATPVAAGLDVRRGAALMPWSAFWAGAAILAPFAVLGAWAMLENEHFEQFVRIQDDRGHRVVDTGPYRLVRHPGYLGAMFAALATPLMLGTPSAFAPAVLAAALFVWRTALEDRTLRRDLPGYADYAGRTRARLIPGLW